MNVQHDLQASHQCKGCFIHLHQIFYFTFSSKPIRPFCPPPLCLNGLVLIEVCVIKETSGWVSKLEKHIKHHRPLRSTVHHTHPHHTHIPTTHTPNTHTPPPLPPTPHSPTTATPVRPTMIYYSLDHITLHSQLRDIITHN